MNYQTVILRLLNFRQFVVCHKDLLMLEFDENAETRVGLENWCLYHGLEVQYINDSMLRLSKKSTGMMEFNAFLS
jgi:hypothetical protein